MRKLVCAAVLIAAAASAQAAITVQSAGPVPPPATIGPWTAVEVPDPGVPDFTIVTTIDTLGADKSFSFTPGLEKRTTPGSWGSWSYGYTGPVYWSMFQSSVTIDLAKSKDWIPVGFSLAAEPNAFGLHQITVTATTSSGQSVSDSQLVEGLAGANRWDIWTTAGDWIDTITVTAASSAQGFAIADFALASIPEPASLGLLTLAGMALLRRRG